MPPKKLTLPDDGIEKLIREHFGQCSRRALRRRDKSAKSRRKTQLDRFPEDFMFRLTPKEADGLRYQFGTLKSGRGQHRKYLPYAFTEFGALMAANVLNSSRAVKMSVYVIRAFVKSRDELAADSALMKRLAQIDDTLFLHDSALRDLYQKLRPLLAPPPEPPQKPRIGFTS